MQSTNFPSFITNCEEDENGNLAITFPEELLEALGWAEGTTLDFAIIGNRLIVQAVVGSDFEQAESSS